MVISSAAKARIGHRHIVAIMRMMAFFMGLSFALVAKTLFLLVMISHA
jgi:hypothetical protein